MRVPSPNVVQSTTITIQNLLLLGFSIWTVRRSRPSIGPSRPRSLFDDDGAIRKHGEELTASLSVLGRHLSMRLQVCDNRGLEDDVLP